jgi:hypothetical protein
MPNALVAAAATGLPKFRPQAFAANPSNRLTTTLMPWEGPDVYCLVGNGVCMTPEIEDRAPLMFDRREPCRVGDIVAIWFRPECTPAGQHQILIKRLVRGLPEHITLPGNRTSSASIRVQMLNPFREWDIPVGRLLGLVRCMGPVPEGVKRIRMADDDIRAAGRQS